MHSQPQPHSICTYACAGNPASRQYQTGRKALKTNYNEICIRCNECCKWMTFTIDCEKASAIDRFRKYYEAHGCKTRAFQRRSLIIMIPSVCPQLQDDGKCAIYKDRPVLCREYDGRWDPNMHDKCKLPTTGMIWPEHYQPKQLVNEYQNPEYFKKELYGTFEWGTPEGRNPFYQCPFCGVLDPGSMVCSSCGKLMQPPEDI